MNSDMEDIFNSQNSNSIDFNHTPVDKRYSSVDLDDTYHTEKTTAIDFGPKDTRTQTGAVDSDTSAVEEDTYDYVGSHLPREEFHSFLKAIENEAHKMAGWGQRDNIIQNFVSRLDRFGTALIPMNTLNCGYTFITRPRLNFLSANLRTNPVMATLDTGNPNSVAFMIRCLLDTAATSGVHLSMPRFDDDKKQIDNYHAELFKIYQLAHDSPLIDVHNPFLVPLCNGLKSISGFPDFTIQEETTEGDFHSGDFTFAKGSDMNNSTNELSLEFRDVSGSIILSILFYWCMAIALEAKGIMWAYPDDIYEQRLNYTVSIYRFVMDTSKQNILWWAKATGCFPKSVPIGSIFNVSQGEVILTSVQNFSIPFVANDVKVNDPGILHDFNALVSRYCPSIESAAKNAQEALKHPKNKNMSMGNYEFQYVSNTEPLYNFVGLPYIFSSPTGLRLGWFTSNDYSNNIKDPTNTSNKSDLEQAIEKMDAAQSKYMNQLSSTFTSSQNNDNSMTEDYESARRAKISQSMNNVINAMDVTTGINRNDAIWSSSTSTYGSSNLTTGINRSEHSKN